VGPILNQESRPNARQKTRNSLLKSPTGNPKTKSLPRKIRKPKGGCAENDFQNLSAAIQRGSSRDKQGSPGEGIRGCSRAGSPWTEGGVKKKKKDNFGKEKKTKKKKNKHNNTVLSRLDKGVGRAETTGPSTAGPWGTVSGRKKKPWKGVKKRKFPPCHARSSNRGVLRPTRGVLPRKI